MFMGFGRRPPRVRHFSRGKLIAPGTWPFLKSFASRTSMMTTSSFFSIRWLISTGPVVNDILSAKNRPALAALFLMALIIMISFFYGFFIARMLSKCASASAHQQNYDDDYEQQAADTAANDDG